MEGLLAWRCISWVEMFGKTNTLLIYSNRKPYGSFMFRCQHPKGRETNELTTRRLPYSLLLMSAILTVMRGCEAEIILVALYWFLYLMQLSLMHSLTQTSFTEWQILGDLENSNGILGSTESSRGSQPQIPSRLFCSDVQNNLFR